MSHLIYRTLILSPFLLLLPWSTGCSSVPYRSHPEYHRRIAELRALGVIAWNLRVYKVTSQGAAEKREDWEQLEGANLVRAVCSSLRERSYLPKALPPADADLHDQGWQELRVLYGAVEKSIRLHTYGPQLFPMKRKDFDYSLGSIQGLLEQFHVDSLVLVSGMNAVGGGPRNTYLSVALADASGAILWYCVKSPQKQEDLRDPIRAAVLVKDLLSLFPKAGG